MDIPTILIVDDEPGQRESIKNMLEPRIQCKIAQAGSGQEAINYIKKNPCDLMIVDIRMPEKSGLEVLDEARDLPISTIAVTAWDSEQVYKECKKRGIKEYIPKGSSLTVLYDKTVKELKAKDKYFPKT